jgi:rod shape-determining protein MreC
LATAGIQKSVWAGVASASDFLPPFFDFGNLIEENKRLRMQAAGFLAQQAQIEALLKENEFLRRGLNLELEKNFDLKIADIVGKISARDVLVIDKGSRDLVEAGMMVIDSQNAIAGKIVKTYDNFSEVLLITDKDFSFDVSIGGDETAGLLRGRGNYRAEIDLVPKDKILSVGQIVNTGGLGGIFPAGLLAGSIKEVRQNDVESFQSAEISPAFDATKARQVFVAVGKKPLDDSLISEINQTENDQ